MNARRYFATMAARSRVWRITPRTGASGWVTGFLARSVPEAQAFHARPLWTTPPDAPTGPVLYLDYLLTGGWSKPQRAAVVAAMQAPRTSAPTVTSMIVVAFD